jgi:hypothetical protein
MNSVTAPSLAPASFTNLVTSAVRSTKPAPDVSTVSSDVTMAVAETLDEGLREIDLDRTMKPQLFVLILKRRKAGLEGWMGSAHIFMV